MFVITKLRGGIVLTVTPVGVIVRRVERLIIAGKHLLSLTNKTADQKATELILIEDLSKYSMTKLRAAVPREFPAELALQTNRIFATPDTTATLGPTHSLVKFSCLQGFPHLLVDHMKQLARMYKYKDKRQPTSEKGWFFLLARNIIPDITQEMLDELWKLRGSQEKANREAETKSNLFQNIEHCVSVLDDNDVKDVENLVKQARIDLERMLKEKSHPSMAGVRTASRGSYLEIDDARTLIPPGCLLRKDDVVMWRWIGEMPAKKTNPKSVSKCWLGKSENLSEAASLKIVLKTLWQWYEKVHSMPCPHDWDELFHEEL